MTPGNAVTIRPATSADLPAIVAMRDELNELELRACPHAAITPLTLEQFTTLWSHTLDSPTHCWRVVEVDRKPIGFGLLYLSMPRVDPSSAYLHWAYLRPTVRRRGAGQTLFEHMVAWAQAQGVTRLELQFIEGNLPAQKFWTKMGFRPYASRCVRYLTGPTNSSR
ncbi:MAG: GNAT family N-acetyltransferase [Gemmataceae bacterium]|nr:GNAT family N-acetyltransferase [Gemmataceae bacterium]